jgi:hypothetical protein
MGEHPEVVDIITWTGEKKIHMQLKGPWDGTRLKSLKK